MKQALRELQGGYVKMLMNRHNSVPKMRNLNGVLAGEHIGQGGEIDRLGDEGEVSVTIAIIDENAFARDCLARCLRDIERDHTILTFDSIEHWQRTMAKAGGAVVLLCAVGQKATEHALRHGLAALRASDPRALCILMSDSENPDQMLDAIESGARGYIPSSIGLDVAVEAIRLVRAGGTFIPASALVRSRTATDQIVSRKDGARSLFTARQAEVVKALRRGQPNKLIAYELNMGEGTVKVHIRNIMKKLNARNRTEVAFLTNEMFPAEDESL